MTTQANNQTSHLPQHVADAIDETRRAIDAHDHSIARRTAAEQTHLAAADAYHADCDNEQLNQAYNSSIDALCDAIRTESAARTHREQTRATLENIWAEYLKSKTGI